MAFQMDEVWVNDGQFMVTKPNNEPEWMAVKGEEKVLHTTYLEGNTQVGKAGAFGSPSATTMIGREDKVGTNKALHTKGNVRIDGDSGTGYALDVSGGAGDPLLVRGDIICQAISPARLSTRFSDADDRPKPFDIKHPSKEGWRLRYACIEGPEVGVYCRGRVRNEKIIGLPSYWKDLVHIDSISVQLQPIGAHQDIIVKRWDDQYIYLQAQGGLPINCFYHVYAERKDINPLITEYEGEKCSDYPDPNHHSIPEAERSYNDERYRSNRNTITG